MAARRSRPDARVLRRGRSSDRGLASPRLAEALEQRAVPGSLMVTLPSILPESKDAQLSAAYAANDTNAQRSSMRYERPRWNIGAEESDVLQRKNFSQRNKLSRSKARNQQLTFIALPLRIRDCCTTAIADCTSILAFEALAQALPQPAIEPRDGVGGNLPAPRCLRLDWQQPSRGPEALPAGD